MRRSASPSHLFDDHLNRQHRLSYFARGAEWAFALPQGDLSALDDVMRVCAANWNGAGSVFIPVDKRGRIRPADDILRVRPVDTLWMHPSLGDRARIAISSRFEQTQPMYEGFDDAELHPLLLVPETATQAERGSMLVPVASTVELRRVTLALWGDLPADDLPYWRSRFDITEAGGDSFMRALIEGQTGTASPLTIGMSSMGMIRQSGPAIWPHAYVYRRVRALERSFGSGTSAPAH